MKPLTEKEIREIVQDELKKNVNAGSPIVPPHDHDGTDSFPINPINLVGFTSLPSSTKKYLVTTYDPSTAKEGDQEYGFASPQQLLGGDPSSPSQFLSNANIAQYPIPIVFGFGVGTSSNFNGGYAPEGTLVYFSNATVNGLYIRVEGGWRGVNFNLTA